QGVRRGAAPRNEAHGNARRANARSTEALALPSRPVRLRLWRVRRLRFGALVRAHDSEHRARQGGARIGEEPMSNVIQFPLSRVDRLCKAIAEQKGPRELIELASLDGCVRVTVAGLELWMTNEEAYELGSDLIEA